MDMIEMDKDRQICNGLKLIAALFLEIEKNREKIK